MRIEKSIFDKASVKPMVKFDIRAFHLHKEVHWDLIVVRTDHLGDVIAQSCRSHCTEDNSSS